MSLSDLFSRPSAASARLIAGGYAVLGTAWVFGPEKWVAGVSSGRVGSATGAPALWSEAGALLFVASSALALYFFLRRWHQRLVAAHQAELAAASRYRALLDASLDGIHVVDTEGRLVEANRAFYLSLGHDPARPPPLRVTDWDARWSADEVRAKAASLLHRSEVFETTHRRRDGSLVAVEVSASGMEIGGRRLLLCIARDLAARRQMERVHLRSERLESLGLLASGVAHDLNNALSPVILGTELLRSRYPGSRDDPLLVSMCAAAKRGAGIIRQLLTFARGVEGARLPLAVGPLLAEVVQIARDNLPTTLRVALELGADLPRVRGDAAQLHHVLMGLVANARDAQPEGGKIFLRARTRTLAEAESSRLPEPRAPLYLELSVRDAGPGLSAEARAHLFEPFFTTKCRGQGTGLALSTALGVVRSHGGTIEHVAPPEGGAEFRVLLPADLSAEETKGGCPDTGSHGGTPECRLAEN